MRVVFNFILILLIALTASNRAHDSPVKQRRNEDAQHVTYDAISALSELDKTSLLYDANFQKKSRIERGNFWLSIANIRDASFVPIAENFIAAQPTYRAFRAFCAYPNESKLAEISKSPLIIKTRNKLRNDLRMNETTVDEALKTVPQIEIVAALCRQNWITIFSRSDNAVRPITNQLLAIESDSAGASPQRYVTFGSSPEFELAAATYCLIAADNNNKTNSFNHNNNNSSDNNTITKCKFRLEPSKNVVVLNVARTKNDNKITDVWLELSSEDNGVEVTTATNRIGDGLRERKKKKKPKPDQQLEELVADMWDADSADRLPESSVVLNYGQPANPHNDQIQDDLITSLNESIFERPVYKALINIWNAPVFHPKVCEEEKPLAGERLELIETFIATLTNTSTFQHAYDYLKKKGQADENLDVFRKKLTQDWFGNYSRCRGPLGSSGFEHVFCGEYRGTIVDGHHSWINYWMAQQNGTIEYHGYYTYREKNIVTIRYKKDGYLKATGGFLFRSSPAFDFSLFTVCYLTHRGNEACRFKIAGDDFWVTSFSEACTDGYCIATSYPGTNLPAYASPDSTIIITLIPTTSGVTSVTNANSTVTNSPTDVTITLNTVTVSPPVSTPESTNDGTNNGVPARRSAIGGIGVSLTTILFVLVAASQL